MEKRSPRKDTYHHGSLRQTLLAVAEEELAERGTDGFSLRSVAARAGVSHAAPKRHFADLRDLLTAVAASAFQRFTQAMQAVSSDLDPVERLIGVAQSYAAFATEHPALFDLQFFSSLPNREDPEFVHHSEASFLLLADVAARAADAPEDEPLDDRLARARLIWAFTHGVAALQARTGGGRENEVETLLRAGIPRLLAGETPN